MLIGEELTASIYSTVFTVGQAILTDVVWCFKLFGCLWVLSALAFAVIRAVRCVLEAGGLALLGVIGVALVDLILTLSMKPPPQSL